MKYLLKKFRPPKPTVQHNQTPKNFNHFLDSPKYELTDSRWVTVKGWLIPNGNLKIQSLRLKNNEQVYELPYGLYRPDVAQVFSNLDSKKTANSGFLLEFEFEDGSIEIEVNFGTGWEKVDNFNLKYSGEQSLNSAYNPHLGRNWIEHLSVLKDKSQYFFEPELNASFQRSRSDAKVLAFYLPQFYPIAQNDQAWGKGFTEWQNVTTAQARFVGHHQPIFPRDLGYYDLRLPENLTQQIKLAKQHGLYGFCFYYYWFSGQQLLEKPLNTFLEHKDWDFNFMICWANENWTKRWDGQDKEIIIAQKYLASDPLNFIKAIESILLDPRYIRIDDKPVLAVYQVADLKNPLHYTKVWRQYFWQKHQLKLHLISVLSFDTQDPQAQGFDGAIDFMPQGVNYKSHIFAGDIPPQVNVQKKLLDMQFEGLLVDYRQIVLNQAFQQHRYPFETYKCVMPGWDNDARKKGKGTAFHYSSPDLYAHWLDQAIQHQPTKDSLVFVNAWNEWGEGTTLEPTLHYGHALLHRTAEIIAKHSKRGVNRQRFPLYGIRRKPTTKLAVVIHLYYPDMWNAIRQKLANLNGLDWDLFVNLPAKDQAFSATIKQSFPDVRITTLPNRGRDILPFLHLARRLDAQGYKAILKLHSKKSEYRKFSSFRTTGKEWFNDLTNNVLPNKTITRKLAQVVSQGNSFIGPKGHYISLGTYLGSNADKLELLLSQIFDTQTAKTVLGSTNRFGYFAGSMFWTSIDAIKPILDLHLMPEDFESESGQVDGTQAHTIERLFGVVTQLNRTQVYVSSRLGIKKLPTKPGRTKYKYIS